MSYKRTRSVLKVELTKITGEVVKPLASGVSCAIQILKYEKSIWLILRFEFVNEVLQPGEQLVAVKLFLSKVSPPLSASFGRDPTSAIRFSTHSLTMYAIERSRALASRLIHSPGSSSRRTVRRCVIMQSCGLILFVSTSRGVMLTW